MSDIASDFIDWVLNTAKIPKQVLDDSELKQRLDPLLQAVVANQNNSEALNQAVVDYLTVAKAGQAYLADKASGKISSNSSNSSWRASSAASELGISPSILAPIQRQVQQKLPAGTQVRRTGNATADGILTALGITLTESDESSYSAEDSYETSRRSEENYRRRQIENHNLMVEQTMRDLRNATALKTGQEQFFQQQLAQLMATKY